MKHPGVTILSIFALALGIGSLTVTFGITDTYLLRPLPFADADRLVHLWSTNERYSVLRTSVPDLLDWRAQAASFDGLAAFNYSGADLTGGDRPERLAIGSVSADVFEVLGVRPVLGRGFQPGEDAPGQGGVVVLSHRFWETRYAGDRGVLGQTLELSGRRYEIIGVMPPDFVFPLPITQLWIPRELDTALYTRDTAVVQVVGRLKPGVSAAQAQAEMDGIARNLADEYPGNAGRGVNIQSLRGALNFADEIIRVMSVVLGLASLFVLLIACANISSLLLGRAIGRAREVAVRSALGASRARLVRQFLIESVVLALAGGAVGVLLAAWVTRAMAAVIPDDLYRIGELSIDGRALAVSLLASLGTAVLFGLVPALRSSRQDLNQTLRETGTSVTTSRSGQRMQAALVVGELALAVTLLVGTTLMIRTHRNLGGADLGFDRSSAFTATIALPSDRYGEPAQIAQFHRDVAVEIGAVPGVTGVATANFLPLNHESSSQDLTIPGRDLGTAESTPFVSDLSVSPGYFSVMRIPLSRGRAFTDADRAGTEPVVIVNETLARQYWPDDDPLGRRIELSDAGAVTIVGVVGDAKLTDISAEPVGQVYLPQAQRPWRYVRVIARTAGEPLALSAEIDEAVWRVDPNLPITEVRSLTQVVQDYLLPQSLLSSSLGGLALGALVLALTGIYGLMAFFVSQRTQEIGIRMALGAAPRDALALVLKRGLWLALTGVGAGLLGAFGLAQVMASLLFGVGAVDPLAFAAVPALLLAVALLSCYLPARRAATVDPVVSLKYE